MFTLRKKRIALEMINGVDHIKLVLFKVLNLSIINKYPEYEKDFCGKLAGASVNEIFGEHNIETEEMYKEYKNIIEYELKQLAVSNSDLVKSITDSLRVYVQANWMLGSKKMGDSNYTLSLFQKAIDRGLFIKGGDAPQMDSFLELVNEVSNKYLS